MPQEVGNRFDVHPGLEPRHSRRVAHGVHTDVLDTGLTGRYLDGPQDIARLDECAHLGGETLVGLSKNHAVTIFYPATTRRTYKSAPGSYTTLLDATGDTRRTLYSGTQLDSLRGSEAIRNGFQGFGRSAGRP